MLNNDEQDAGAIHFCISKFTNSELCALKVLFTSFLSNTRSILTLNFIEQINFFLKTQYVLYFKYIGKHLQQLCVTSKFEMNSRHFKIFRFSPAQFLRYQFLQKSSFWVNWYETWYWNKQKYRWLHLQCKQLANGVSNCLEPLLIFPWVMNIHIAHCVYTLYMLECKIWKTARECLCVGMTDKQSIAKLTDVEYQ